MARRSIHLTILSVLVTVLAIVPASLFAAATGPATLTVYSEDAEGAGAAARFTTWINGTAPQAGLTKWQLVDASTAAETISGAHSPSHFWYAGFEQTPAGVTTLGYSPATDVSLITPTLDLRSPGVYRTATLTFWESGLLDPIVHGDRFVVLVKNVTDAQTQWRTLFTSSIDDPEYVLRSLDLTPWIGHIVQVRFRMTSAQASIAPVDGAGIDLDDIAVTYSDPLSAPSAPLLPRVTAASGSAIALAWDAPASNGGSAITNYEVARGPAVGAPDTTFDVGTARAFTDDTVVSGEAYRYSIRATNAIGTGPASADVLAAAVSPVLPGAPTSFAATGGAGQVGLARAAPADTGGAPVERYHVYRDGVDVAQPTTVTFVDTTMTIGVTHAYAVAAENLVGVGPQTASQSAVATPVSLPAFHVYQDPAPGSRTGEIGVGGTGLQLTDDAGEPSIGVDQLTGDVLMQINHVTVKMHPDAANGVWTDVSYPFAEWLPVSDPIGYLDPATNRYFGGTILGTCSQLGFTDDAGATWTPTSGACDSLNGHDHETVGGGPFPPGFAPATDYPDAVWYCAQQNLVAKCALSVDGGLTFLPAVPIYDALLSGGPTGLGTCIGIHGHIRVAPNGSAVVPNNACGSSLAVQGGGITYDGLVWHGFTVPGTTSRHFDPSAAFGADGTLYFGLCNGDGKAKAAVSHDGARTWSTPVDVGAAAGILNCEFPEMIAGDGDRAAFAFLGSTVGGDDQLASFTGLWHLYVAITTDGGATWTLTDATGADPVQAGCIDAAGTLGGGCGNRNLLDFNDIALDALGRVVVGYADGCVGACVANPTHGASTSAVAAIAYQTGGPCLYATRCPVASNVLAATAIAGSGDVGAPLPAHATASGGVPPYAYAWTVVATPASSTGGVFADDTAADTTFTPDVGGAFTLRVTVTDSLGAVATADAPLLARVTCAVVLATDTGGDATTGKGRADALALRAGDSPDSWDVCFQVASFADASAGSTRFSVGWNAPYEGPTIGYSMRAVYGQAGNLVSTSLLKGVGGVSGSILSPTQPVTSRVVGDLVIITVPRSAIGAPGAGGQATGIVATIGDDGAGSGTTWDRAPNTGTLTYTFN